MGLLIMGLRFSIAVSYVPTIIFLIPDLFRFFQMAGAVMIFRIRISLILLISTTTY